MELFLKPKLSDFFTLHKVGGEAEKPFRAITFDRWNQPWGRWNDHPFGERIRFIAQTYNASLSKRVGGISASLVK
jgi:hypothetical protein